MKILYCSAGGVGNVVMSTPAMRALAELGHEVTVFVKPRDGEGSAQAAGLLRGWSALEDVVTGEPREVIRPERFDLAVHSVWSFDRGFHPDERTAGVIDLSKVHEAEANMIPVRELGYSGAMPLPTLSSFTGPVSPGLYAGRDVDSPGRTRTVCVSPSGSAGPETGPVKGNEYWALAPGCNPDPLWDRKRWGGWAALAKELRGLSVFLGASGDSVPFPGDDPGLADAEVETQAVPVGRGPLSSRPAGRQASKRCRGRVIDLTGRTTLREAASVIAGSRAFVGIDCGLAHVAAALGVPTVVLFGATSEVKNRPLGPRVRLMTLDLPCRPCQMTPAWDECVVWRCMAFDHRQVLQATTHAGRDAGRDVDRPCRTGTGCVVTFQRRRIRTRP